MSQPTIPDSPVATANAAPSQRRLPGLRFPFVSLLFFWVVNLGSSAFQKPYFVGFMLGILTCGLLTILFFSWWWFNRGLSISEKLLGFALIAAEMVLVGR